MSRSAAMTFAVAFLATASHSALASPPPADAMDRLAAHAADFEKLTKRASYVIDGHMDTLAGDGAVKSIKEMKARVESDGRRGHFGVVEYREDGEDKTEKAKSDAKESDAKFDKKSEKEREEERIRNPLLATEQPRYTFDVVAEDAASPSRVRLSFTPKRPDKHSIEGSAWVDTERGTVLSASFKMSKPGLFVDHVHFVLEFQAETPLGPSVSKLVMDANGGFLFFRKHVRAEATFSEYRLAP